MPAYASKGVGRAGYDKPTAREPRSARKHLTNARHEACAHKGRCMPTYASKGVGRAGYDKPTAREPRCARKLLTKSCGG